MSGCGSGGSSGSDVSDGSQQDPQPLIGAQAPATAATDRAEIADVINEVREGFADGDGALVCGYLTSAGAADMTDQDVVPFIEEEVDARIEGVPLEPTCESAVASFTDGLTSSQRRQLAGVLTYRSTDVDLGTTVDGSPETVRVRCLESSGRAWFATEEVAGWKLELPFCAEGLARVSREPGGG